MTDILKKPNLKVTIHESSVESDEIFKFLKGIGKTDFSFTSELPFTTDNLVIVNQKVGSQIDAVHAKLRMNGVIPGLQDLVIFGSSWIIQALAYSKKYPDTRVLLIPGLGEFVSDLPNEGNIRGSNWQMIHEYICNKTDSKVKTKKQSKPLGMTHEGKSKRKDTESTYSKARPAETEQHFNEEENSESDPRYD